MDEKMYYFLAAGTPGTGALPYPVTPAFYGVIGIFALIGFLILRMFKR